jgi:hypothetical protein
VNPTRHEYFNPSPSAACLAEQLANPEGKRILLGIAVSFVALVHMAAERDAAKHKCRD